MYSFLEMSLCGADGGGAVIDSSRGDNGGAGIASSVLWLFVLSSTRCKVNYLLIYINSPTYGADIDRDWIRLC